MLLIIKGFNNVTFLEPDLFSFTKKVSCTKKKTVIHKKNPALKLQNGINFKSPKLVVLFD